MVKLLMLQSWYGLSDPELERQANDRISFHRFLGFPDAVPDATTVWLFRDRLAEIGKDREVWAELQRQLDETGLSVRKGVVQDASFIKAWSICPPKDGGREFSDPDAMVGRHGWGYKYDGARLLGYFLADSGERVTQLDPGISVALNKLIR